MIASLRYSSTTLARLSLYSRAQRDDILLVIGSFAGIELLDPSFYIISSLTLSCDVVLPKEA